jgi:hypothetical protein
MKMMPEMSNVPSHVWRPLEHDSVDMALWRWQNYHILYSLDNPTKANGSKRMARAGDITQSKII